MSASILYLTPLRLCENSRRRGGESIHVGRKGIKMRVHRGRHGGQREHWPLEDLSIYSVARANTPQHEHEGAGLLCLLSPLFLLFLFFLPSFWTHVHVCARSRPRVQPHDRRCQPRYCRAGTPLVFRISTAQS